MHADMHTLYVIQRGDGYLVEGYWYKSTADAICERLNAVVRDKLKGCTEIFAGVDKFHTVTAVSVPDQQVSVRRG